MTNPIFKLEFYVPEQSLESVKQAVFATGAGKIGNYDSCCWQTQGKGQFRPLSGSEPFIGQKGKVETVAEYKVELVVEKRFLDQAIAALKKSHPYEEPAYSIYKTETFAERDS